MIRLLGDFAQPLKFSRVLMHYSIMEKMTSGRCKEIRRRYYSSCSPCKFIRRLARTFCSNFLFPLQTQGSSEEVGVKKANNQEIKTSRYASLFTRPAKQFHQQGNDRNKPILCGNVHSESRQLKNQVHKVIYLCNEKG